MKKSRLFGGALVFLVLCLLLCTAVAEADDFLRPFRPDELRVDLTRLGNAVEYQSSFSEDGRLSMVVDGNATDWKKAVMCNDLSEELYLELYAYPPAGIDTENLYITVYSGSFKSEEEILLKLPTLNPRYFMKSWIEREQEDVIAYRLATWFEDRSLVSPYYHADSESTRPIKNAYLLVYAVNHGTDENRKLETVAARYVMMDVTFAQEDTGWAVEPIGAMSSPVRQALWSVDDWVEDHPAVSYESEVLDGQGHFLFDPSMDVPEDFWREMVVHREFIAPQGAVGLLQGSAFFELEGTPELPASLRSEWGDLFWDFGNNRPHKNHTERECFIWLDENGDMMEESGIYYSIVTNLAAGDYQADQPWMEYQLSNTFAKLPATRFDVDISTSAKNDVFACAALPGYAHFMIHPNYEFDMQDMVDLTTKNAAGMPPYSAAFYRIKPPTGAKYFSTFIANYDNLRGMQPGTYNHLVSSMLLREKKAVVPGEKVEMFAGNFIEAYPTQYAGVKLARSNMHLAGGESGRVYFVAWFDASEELMKIEWVCEETEEILFEADTSTYTSFGSVPASLNVPALVDFDDRGAALNAAFALQAPEKDAEGYAGYAVQLSANVPAAMELDGQEEELENLYVFLPYLMDANRRDDMFKLVRYQDGAEQDVSFDTGMSGISFRLTSADECTYVLKWKDDPAVQLPEELICIEPYAFENAAFVGVYCGDDVESIGAYAFKDAVNMEKIYVPAQTSIDETAFEGCTALKVIQSDMHGGDASSMAQKLNIEFQVVMR